MKRKRNRRFAWTLALCMLLPLWQMPLTALAQAAQARTPSLTMQMEGDFILITSAQELAQVMNDTSTYADAKLRLTQSIDMAGQPVQPLGNSSTPFSGTFDGNGKTISHLTIESSTGYTGLFGSLTGTVQDLTLERCTVSDTNESFTKGIGALVGYNRGTVQNCQVTDSTVTAQYRYLGGLVGNNAGTITGSAVEKSSVQAQGSATMAQAGGLVGYNDANGSVTHSYVWGGKVAYTGSDTGRGQEIGGFVGRNASSTSKITACYSTAKVVSNGAKVGGFAGSIYNGTLEHCFATGSASGLKTVGGFAGEHFGKTVSCYATGDVVSTAASNYFGRFYGDGFPSGCSTTYYLTDTVSITGNGTERAQSSSFTGVSANALKAAAAQLGSAWKADADHNDGYPYLQTVRAPGNSASTDPSGPVKLAAPSGLEFTQGVASWDAVPKAAAYTLCLYQKQTAGADKLIRTYEGLTATQQDVAADIVHTGTYYVTVQAMGDGTDTAERRFGAEPCIRLRQPRCTGLYPDRHAAGAAGAGTARSGSVAELPVDPGY